MSDPGSTPVFDVIIIGAGISGIDTAYRVQTELPSASYAVLEARAAVGGTWDLFRYPGIRSDSDLYTFGFPWRPWTRRKVIASGEAIRDYIRESAAAAGIEPHIRCGHRVVAADWAAEQQAWRLRVDAGGPKEEVLWACFVVLGTGYYDYAQALPSTVPGIERFAGQVVHPQFWPEGLDYAGKKVVVIGSGATAVTLLPVLAEKAERVTMLQRSPGYIVSVPSVDRSAQWLGRFLPAWLTYSLIRLKYLVMPTLFFKFCRSFPNAARKVMRKGTVELLPKHVPHDPNFEPKYNPWEQRLCVSPDGDFFKSLHSGKSDVVTGVIETVTETGIRMESGRSLDADIIITATGLKLQVGGGAHISVDGERVEMTDKFIWHNLMLQDVPNLATIVGYTNASWTLGADSAALHICRLLKYMQANKITSAVPRMKDPSSVKAVPLLNLNSTYVERGKGALPKAGDRAPWKPRSTYLRDMWDVRFGNLSNGLQFSRVSG
ncbi:hypothetical protein MMC26_001940 [Xylographa opegraphella]|nr:hypothetical protein [Xylographa opegraphella]